MNIGIFDSGLGGLHILKTILEVLPEYNYLYLGDNARVPYGSRSPELIYQFTKQAVEFLFAHDCKLVILACNTATANALKRLQTEYLPFHYSERKILGIVYPVVEETIEQAYHRVGIIATRATVYSESYPKEFQRLAPQIQVFQQSCPLLVPLIEEGETEWEGLDLLLEKYLQPLLLNNIEALILGCTHYGLISERIKKHLPNTVQIISQAEATAKKLKLYLEKHQEIDAVIEKNSKRTFYVTDLNERYQALTKRFLGEEIIKGVELQLVSV